MGHEPVPCLLAGLQREDLSVGRVQTPTLAMIVERELAIRKFVPEDYLEVVATFHPQQAPEGQHLPGHLVSRAAGCKADQGIAVTSPCGCRRTARRAEAHREPGANRPGRHRIDRIADAADAAARCSTISRNCSVTRTGCSASARKRRWTWRRRSMSSTS